ncbi:MAG TPA: oligosaccharide flippase family protein [Candidatus Atribacteria bacterium]|nr:oligosaccharide flippase family protein [Candidatus Atribacteria bacterium]
MADSRTKNTMRNAIYGAINQVVMLLLSFVNRTLFIRLLGVEYLGINALFADVLTMLSMADLGFTTAMMYSFYKPLAERDNDRLAALIKLYKRVYNTIAAGVAVIGLALVPFLHLIVNLDKPIPYLRLYYLFFLANTVISYLFTYKTAIINADQKHYLVLQYRTFTSIGRVVLQIIFLLLTHNYFVFIGIQVLSTLVNNLLASREAGRLYPFINKPSRELEREEKHSIFDNVKSIFIYKISSVLLNGTDNTLISVMVGTIWVGYYSNYNLVLNTLNTFINILYTAASASIGHAVVTEKPEKRFEIFKSMQTVSLIISTFTSVCLFVLFSDLVYVWLGSKYVLDYLILGSIILNFYLGGVLHPIWSFRESTGMYMRTKYIMLICAIENLVLSVLLGYVMGMAGILYASAISRLTTYFWYEPRILFGEYFKESTKKFYLPLAKNALLTGALIALFMYASQYFTIDSWPKLVLKTFAVAGLTLGAVVLTYCKTEGFKLLLSRVKWLGR